MSKSELWDLSLNKLQMAIDSLVMTTRLLTIGYILNFGENLLFQCYHVVVPPGPGGGHSSRWSASFFF